VNAAAHQKRSLPPNKMNEHLIQSHNVTMSQSVVLSRVVERRKLIVQLSGRRQSSSKTMTTLSDGGDGLRLFNMSGSSPHSSSSGDMRFHLQSLLDSKEKQLQQAGTLGQQLLAQRMELEERIRMLQDMELDGGEGDDVRDKYRDLVDTIKTWDAENEQLSGALRLKVRPICASNPHANVPPDASFSLSTFFNR
jgi:hypothetical protein